MDTISSHKRSCGMTGTVRRIFLFLFAFVLFAGTALAQNVTVSGNVKDNTGEPLMGVSVVVINNTTQYAITDLDGNYSISGVAPDAKLSVEYIGMKGQQIAVGGRTQIDIVMEPEVNELDQVVVTALGIKRAQKALGYSMTELKSTELNANLINPVTALQGKVAGVEISQSDGGMFGASKILIRGASTLGKNNQPIYVVDGIILDNNIVENDADWGSGAANYGNELKNLNPDDFESVSVLKGAAATALYGSRGLNGAVVITTKSGKGGQGLGVNFTQTLGFDRVTSQPRFQNDYMEGQMAGYNTHAKNRFNTEELYATDPTGQYPSLYKLSQLEDTGNSWGIPFSSYDKIEWYDQQLIDSKANKNNFRDAYGTGFTTNTNLAVNGSTEKSSFYASMSYKYSNGTLPNNSFNRFSLLAKAQHRFGKSVNLEAGITFTNSNPRNAQANIGEKFIDGTFDRTYDSKYYRDKYKGDHGGLAEKKYGDKWGYVPGRSTWWSIWENDYSQKETVIRPNLKMTVDCTPWLKWVTEGSFNYYYVRTENKVAGSGYQNYGGSYTLGLSTKEQTNFNTNLIFDSELPSDFHINGFLRYELYNNYQVSESSSTKGHLIVPNQYFLDNGSEGYTTTGKISATKMINSLAGQIGFSWKNQIYVDVTGRNDWSSALVYADGHGTFSYFYPSVNASWIISESFKNKFPAWITFMKVRGSFAQVGNDTDAYKINSAYNLSTYLRSDNSQYYALEKPTQVYSQDLKPEKKSSWEVGLDWRMFDSRLGIDFTYYKENTRNQIMSVAIPSVSGYSSALINAGNIQNQGVEIALNTTPVMRKNVTWDLNFTYTKNASKIVELSPLVTNYIALQGTSNYGNYRIGSVAQVGGEYGVLMSDSSPAIDAATGQKILVYDKNNRNAYYKRSGTEEVIGSMMPDFLGSINTSLKLWNFTLSASFDMRFGGKVASYGSRYGTAYGYTSKSLAGRNAANGGITWTSAWDGVEYHDGVIPEGIIPNGTEIEQADGSIYVVGGESGETYAQLYNAGKIEPTHASTWTNRNNAWSTGTVNSDWFVDLNYIAFRDLSLSYSFDQKLISKIRAKALSLTFSAHNLGYLLNSMPNGENPEAVAGTAAAEFRIRQYSGVTTNFVFTINAAF